MIDLGSGSPLLVIPGIQGRWEWMRPAVHALATRLRTLTFSLCGEAHSECIMDRSRGFQNFVDQIDSVLDRSGVTNLAIAGVSFGGLIALRYAAARPDRVRKLILVSTPGPRWRPAGRAAAYMRWPRLLAPLFVATSPFRLWPEIYAAHSTWAERVSFTACHLARVISAPFSPPLMAERLRLTATSDRVSDCGSLSVPTLLITGENGLDRVVPVDSTLEYRSLIQGAVVLTLERTGHLGLVTRPAAFATAVSDFVTSRAEQPEHAAHLESENVP